MSRLYVGLLCSIASISLGGCLKAPNEWLGIPFVPEAYRVRWGGIGYSYRAPVPVEEAISWYQARLREAGWSVPAMGPRHPRREVVSFEARRGSEEMVVVFGIYGASITGISVYDKELEPKSVWEYHGECEWKSSMQAPTNGISQKGVCG